MNRASNNGFQLDAQKGYFRCEGVNIMAFDGIYPEGHQAGVSLLMHGQRLATNGDIRFEPTPGQWQPVPKQIERTVSPEANAIVTRLAYPDLERHARGFNPMIYPDYAFSYAVTVRALGPSVEVTVSLDEPLPKALQGLLFFNMELFPGALFGRPWIMDEQQGIFPRQPNGPVMSRTSYLDRAGVLPVPEDSRAMAGHLMDRREYNPLTADGLVALPYAEGRRFTACPDDPLRCFTVESTAAPLKLYDGRMNHNNGWFVLSSEIPAGVAENAVRWIITPRVVEGWRSAPVVQISQVGYHPAQEKAAVIELDERDDQTHEAELLRVTAEGVETALRSAPEPWGTFLRYRYLRFDFSAVQEEGLYKICCGGVESHPFRIARDIYERGVWQPVLEYFLPVQMCHMRVTEKYRVWHDLCHMDDARMAPVSWNHIDGYVQGPSTLTRFAPGDHVPGLNQGGWHDAGDFDLRVESQAGECYILALAYECFGVDYDATTVDQAR
ncbi:MAG: glycoside hydrolase, partial [Clostridia bacterium]|nr:glycoside hydrolase [Clostridia bacterium]